MRRCHVCKQLVPAAETHVVSTSSGFGRANRCNPCGERVNAELVAFNAEIHRS